MCSGKGKLHLRPLILADGIFKTSQTWRKRRERLRNDEERTRQVCAGMGRFRARVVMCSKGSISKVSRSFGMSLDILPNDVASPVGPAHHVTLPTVRAETWRW
jgi:hypothetical protein